MRSVRLQHPLGDRPRRRFAMQHRGLVLRHPRAGAKSAGLKGFGLRGFWQSSGVAPVMCSMSDLPVLACLGARKTEPRSSGRLLFWRRSRTIQHIENPWPDVYNRYGLKELMPTPLGRRKQACHSFQDPMPACPGQAHSDAAGARRL